MMSVFGDEVHNLFIDSLRTQVNTTHDLIIQINIEMGPRTKRSKVRLGEQ